jgi:hypothetical protein
LQRGAHYKTSALRAAVRAHLGRPGAALMVQPPTAA